MRYANFKLAHYQMRTATWLAASIFLLFAKSMAVHQTDIRGFDGPAAFLCIAICNYNPLEYTFPVVVYL